jgi:AcrR family transcriptional regulator
MPTATFFNLPEEKRNKLIAAIRSEFSRVPFENVSINRIVQTAEIPRGSFYQYFTDKRDMLAYILSEYKNRLVRFVTKRLQDNKGDLFDTFYAILEFNINLGTEEENGTFFRNLLADMKVNTDYNLEIPKAAPGAVMMSRLSPYINRDGLDLRNENDLADMIGVLLSACRNATTEALLNISQREKTMEKYRRQLELIKRGFCKNKE